MGEILQNTIVFYKAVSAVAMCAASMRKGAGQVRRQSISHMTAQRTIYSHTDIARAAHDTAAYTAAHRHKGNEAAIRKRRFAFIISLQDCQPPTRHPHPRFWRWYENEALSKGRGHFISTFFSTFVKKFRSK